MSICRNPEYRSVHIARRRDAPIRTALAAFLAIAITFSVGGNTVAASWQVSVAKSDMAYPGVSMGEGQVVVVRPGLKADCPNGRIVLSRDFARPSTDGSSVDTIIRYRDLGSTTILSGGVQSTINIPAYSYGSNDQSLVALADGTIVYQIPAFVRSLNASGQWWYKYTFRGAFGPGARGAIVSYASDDCGKTFTRRSTTDSYFATNDRCAFPQPRVDPVIKIGFSPTSAPQSTAPFDMGGSDGPMASVDSTGKRLYLTTSCVGQTQGPNTIKYPIHKGTPAPSSGTVVPTLSGTALGYSDVFSSDDGARTWAKIASVPELFWRTEVATLGDGRPVIGGTGDLWIGTKSGPTAYNFSQVAFPDSVAWGWKKAVFLRFGDGTVGPPRINTNVWYNTHVLPAPWSKTSVVVFIPTTTAVGASSGCDANAAATDVKACHAVNGYEVWQYDAGGNGSWFQMQSIEPTKGALPNASGAVLHLSVASSGIGGPLMAHWYDIDVLTGASIVRGRLYLPDGSTSDVVLSNDAQGQPRTFWLNPSIFMGDYKGNSGFLQQATAAGGTGKFKFAFSQTVAVFEPLWVEFGADKSLVAHTSEVIASQDPLASNGATAKPVHTSPPGSDPNHTYPSPFGYQSFAVKQMPILRMNVASGSSIKRNAVRSLPVERNRVDVPATKKP